MKPTEDATPAPCKHGHIAASQVCYCEHPEAPCRCPIWREHGLAAEYWNRQECPWFSRGPGFVE
jgi:hypothetical protein